ncbi:MAG: 4Fe-4S binding protein [Promethearchaeota archaeon]|nr:MAG: 4Fe-4S binding protein [Candidatus Lokiarchaeota archaeon]
MVALESFVKVLPILASPRNPLSKGAGFAEYLFKFFAEGEFPFLLIGLLLIVVLFTNRFFCGWICPIGTIQDALSIVSPKKKRVKLETHKSMLNLKFFIVILLFIIIIPLGIAKNIDNDFYKDYKASLGDLAENPVGYFSLSEYIFVFFPNLVQEMWDQSGLEPLFTDFWVFVMFSFYIIVLIVAFYYPRAYCRYLCPFGALLAAASDYSFLKLSRSPVRCVGRAECGICEKICPKQIRILDEPFEFFTGNGECNLCLECMEKCPYKAIDFTFG